MSAPNTSLHAWGTPPWLIDFAPPSQPLPREADFVVVGAGFTGLAAAAWLRLLAPDKSVVVLEAARIGDGASGRAGGMALAEAASGDLPGLGDVLAGVQKIFASLRIECDLALPGAWEIGRSGGIAKSPISWKDSGILRVVNEVPGGTLDPGKLVGSLARAAHDRGALVLENHPVLRIDWSERPTLTVARIPNAATSATPASLAETSSARNAVGRNSPAQASSESQSPTQNSRDRNSSAPNPPAYNSPDQNSRDVNSPAQTVSESQSPANNPATQNWPGHESPARQSPAQSATIRTTVQNSPANFSAVHADAEHAAAPPTAQITAGKILLATNGLSLDLSGLSIGAHPKLTLATLTAPIAEEKLQAIGLAEGKPFYTVDFPYLWGRIRPDNSIVWGAGLVDPPPSGNLEEVSIASAEPARMFANFEKRVRGLHPATASIEFTHHWGGPILFRDNWEPIFDLHPQSPNAIVLGAFAGHGVMLSSYLGAWAAEVLLARRALPAWGKLAKH